MSNLNELDKQHIYFGRATYARGISNICAWDEKNRDWDE